MASRLTIAALALLALAPQLASTARAAGDADKDDDAGDDDLAPTKDDKGNIKAGGDACIDEKVKADLFAKRRMRTTKDRLVQQTNRHEITLQGGYYVSDLFDGTYTFGGAYTYHMTEDLGVEASGAYTRLTSSGGPELERTFAVLQDRPRQSLLFDADLVYVPAHAKMRLGGAITHMDLYIVAGAGVVDSVVSSDLSGNGGFGLKFFLNRFLAARVDVRDHVYRQQLLGQKMLVNDLTTTLGVSLFLPVGE
jgi:outer membrane beta-barrel protein